MPDANGFPTEAECIRKLNVVMPDPATAALLRECKPILQAVIAEFQSPAGEDGKGGTNRCFAPYTKTRTWDGTGFAYLHVDDIVPDTTVTVSVYGNSLPDVVLSEETYNLGRNILIRPTYSLTAFPLAYAYGGHVRSIFPRGRQNISVTATWGFAATVPDDVFEAIRCEVCYRLLVEGAVGLNGVGEEISMDGFSISTSVGAINFNLTSPLTVFHTQYVNAVNRYRYTPREPAGRLGRKMY